MTGFGAFVVRSLVDPRGTARLLNSLRLNRGILWSLWLLVICVSTIAMGLTLLVFPSEIENPLLLLPPFGLAVVLGSILVMMIFAFYFTGQMLGGTGRFPGALLLLTWWQGLGVIAQIAQIICLLVLPPLTGIVSLVGMVYLLVALIFAIDVLHGFDNLLKSLATVMIAFFGAVFGLALILTIVGIGAPGGTI